MKVKSAELKAKLPRYLKEVRETGEQIEILLREEPVAYLVPIRNRTMNSSEAVELSSMKARLADVGLRLAVEDVRPVSLPSPVPVVAGDGAEDVSSVESMRGEKDW